MNLKREISVSSLWCAYYFVVIRRIYLPTFRYQEIIIEMRERQRVSDMLQFDMYASRSSIDSIEIDQNTNEVKSYRL